MKATKLRMPRHTGRAQKVLAYLAGQRVGRTVREIMHAVEPRGDRSLMWGCVSTLERSGKLARLKGPGDVRFRVTPTALVDRRRREKPALAAPVTTKHPTPKRPVERAPALIVPVSAGLSSQHRADSAMGRLAQDRRAREEFTRQLHEDVAAYLAAGGAIQTLPRGQVSQPLRFDHSRPSQRRTTAASGSQPD